MKLNRDNYTKTTEPEYITYMYNCNDTNFYMRIKRGTNNTDISIFSGTIEAPENEVKTDNALTAWNTFEQMLDACAPEQASSGGFAQDRQNPNFLPLLAIKQLPSGEHLVTIFLVEDSGAQKVMEQFTITQNAMPSTIPQDKVFVVDWTNQDIIMVLKCEILMLPYPSVQFEDDKNAQVFLFIPKSIGNQGGEEAGNTQAGQEGEGEGEGQEGEGQEGEGKEGEGQEGQEGKKGEGQEGKQGEGKEGEGKEGEGEGQEGKEGEGQEGKEGEGQEGKEGKEGEGQEGKEGEGQEGEGQEGKEGEGQGEGQGQENNEDGQQTKSSEQNPSGSTNPLQNATQQEIINKLAESIDVPASSVQRSFRNVDVGELFLQVQDFEKIKKDLKLPPQTTARSLSQQIINLK
jgi:hypothetical protein